MRERERERERGREKERRRKRSLSWLEEWWSGLQGRWALRFAFQKCLQLCQGPSSAGSWLSVLRTNGAGAGVRLHHGG